MASPACVALIPQWREATNVTVSPETVQTVVVVEAKLSARPEDAVAEIVNGAAPNVWVGNAPNVIVCASFMIVNADVTGVAAS